MAKKKTTRIKPSKNPKKYKFIPKTSKDAPKVDSHKRGVWKKKKGGGKGPVVRKKR